MLDIKMLGFFYQGQGYHQFAVEMNGKQYEGCRRPGSRKTEWTTNNPEYAGIPPKGTVAAIQRAADESVHRAYKPKPPLGGADETARNS